MHLCFANRFVAELPEDPQQGNFVRHVTGAMWSPVQPTPVSAPALVSYSSEMANILGLSEVECRSAQFARVFAGNEILPGMQPFATCYGGHQFGNWAGQLGDGRAISLGEAITEGGQRWELQLKGAGPTPYSRRGDGRAVLRSSVREFLCSEAMHHLGVPTTRALCLVATGDQVMRDMFYDGRPEYEPGAIVCRMAPSFIRFGHFELLAQRRDIALLEKLVLFTMRRDFPMLGEPSRDKIPEWLGEVARRSARLVVDWMRVGFVHGVLNTDNMSILGLTIDYGPYGWLEDYDPSWTPNTTDAAGRRYAYGQQPAVVGWNVERLVSALLPLLGGIEAGNDVMKTYVNTLRDSHRAMMANRLGLTRPQPADDEELLLPLLRLLQQRETDMTIFFRRLSQVPSAEATTDDDLLRPVQEAYYSTPSADDRAAMVAWLRMYTRRLRADGRQDEERTAAMNACNPKYVLRNYLAQEAIEHAAAGDPGRIDELLSVLRRPYDEQPAMERYAAKRPEWALNMPGCSMLSCSS